MEAAAACCAGLRKNFGGHIALPIRTRNTNARSLIKPPTHTNPSTRPRRHVLVISKVQEGALVANLQMFPRINNPTNTLKPCANQSTEGNVQSLWKERRKFAKRLFVRNAGVTSDIKSLYSTLSAYPELVELRSTGQPRAAVPTWPSLARAAPRNSQIKSHQAELAWGHRLDCGANFFECHTRNASRVPQTKASREGGIWGETLACSFCHL